MSKKSTYLSVPYFLWAIIFTAVPLLLVFVFAVMEEVDGTYIFTTEHIKYLFQSKEVILLALGRSLKLSAITTILCLILGYPMAYILANSKSRFKGILTTLIILPMWMNFLVRTYSLLTLLERNGLINQFLNLIGLPGGDFLYNETAIVIGMVYNYLPFMILPIHSVLSKMDKRLIEAAEDLGANKKRVFTKVIFPLSLGGVISGIELVFIPSITTFALSQILGGGKALLIGDMIEMQFGKANNWGFGALLSVIVIAIVLLSMYISSKFGDPESEKGGGLLG